MHIVTNSTPIRHRDGILQPGEWLCQDQNAFEFALMAERGTVKITPWSFYGDRRGMRFTAEGEVGDRVSLPRSILLIRSGAIGDLLLLTPAIRALRAKHPKAMIWLSCFKKHWDIFAQGDTHFVEYPVPASELAQFDLITPLENVIEIATEKGIHATDAFAEALGVTVTDYKPVYRITDEEYVWRESNLGNTLKPRVGIQLHASAQIRNYPMAQWNAVLQMLVQRGWEVMLLGNNVAMQGAPKEIKDCSKLSFREAAAVLATCDVFCGVDSSFFNLCPALGVPAIGLFGPVDWRTRIKEGSGQRALVGNGCEPCGWFASKVGVQFPPLGPCAKEKQCVLLESIKPEYIVSKIEQAALK